MKKEYQKAVIMVYELDLESAVLQTGTSSTVGLDNTHTVSDNDSESPYVGD